MIIINKQEFFTEDTFQCMQSFSFLPFSHFPTMCSLQEASQGFAWVRQVLIDFRRITRSDNHYNNKQVFQIQCRYCDADLTNRAMNVCKYAGHIAHAKEGSLSDRHFIIL